MSRIKGKNTKPEMLVRKFLFSQGFRYRLHDKKLPGKPDIILSKYKTVLFIHGCFWHGHEGCRYYVVPKTRQDWWLAKIKGNKIKDTDNIINLQQYGWKVIVIWECDLRRDKTISTLEKVLLKIKESK